MAPRKQELMRLLPIFANAGVVGSEPFTWMTAADYFVCRSVHGVPLIPGTEAHCEAAQEHLSFRFHQFYSNARILQLVVGRLMQNVLAEVSAGGGLGRRQHGGSLLHLVVPLVCRCSG